MADHLLRKRESVTFSIFDETAYTSRQYTVSHATLLSVGVVLLVCIALFASLFFQSFALRHTTADSRSLEAKIAGQHQRIDMRDQQIAFLDSKLTHLKEALGTLEGLESEIRRIARIERTANHDNLFGVGGPKPDTATDADAAETAGSPSELKNQETIGPANIFYAARQNRVTLVLDHSDFIINPMTCVPLVLPAKGTVQNCFTPDKAMASDIPPGHKGIKLITPAGAEVVAPANGIVTYAGNRDPFGYMMIIDHGHGFATRYTRLAEVSQKADAAVQKGETIGFADDSETETHPGHIFYEVFFNGVQVNPETCLSEAHPFSI